MKLNGIQLAWFRVHCQAQADMRHAILQRGNNLGILVKDDMFAIMYRIADHRAERAKFALTGLYGGVQKSIRITCDGLTDETDNINREWLKKRAIEGRELIKLRDKLYKSGYFDVQY